jgi:hypothetical protein
MSNCQHCDAELESPRAKNCALCSQILSDANRARSYAQVLTAAHAARAAGTTGTAVHDAMRAAMSGARDEQHAFNAAQRARDEERKRQRSADAAYFATHGRWPWQDAAPVDPERIEGPDKPVRDLPVHEDDV